jgi:phosphatidylserine decarboxylase
MFVQLQKLLPKHLLSRLVGLLGRSENFLIRSLFINIFCFFYDIDFKEAERDQRKDYRSFNDFFTRSLKTGARSITGEICSPADGQVAALGPITGGTLIQSKSHSYSLPKLLGESAQDFDGGSFITVYLAPHNYHRVHMPCDGELQRTLYIPGELFSVNQHTAADLPNLFANNERLVCRFHTRQGEMALVMVGAMLVAGIQTVWRNTPYPPRLAASENISRSFKQGDELGHFQMGSTVILAFDRALSFALAEQDLVQYGQAITT